MLYQISTSISYEASASSLNDLTISMNESMNDTNPANDPKTITNELKFRQKEVN
jgi:hypothetical protein